MKSPKLVIGRRYYVSSYRQFMILKNLWRHDAYGECGDFIDKDGKINQFLLNSALGLKVVRNQPHD